MTQRPIASGTVPPAVPPRPTFREPPQPLRADLVAEWMLDPSVAFLNHGCFGARPRCVASEQQRWRERIDARPIELLDRRRRDLLADAKHAVGQFLGASPENFGFVTNATNGVNAVLRSLSFSTGDELLTVNHVYNAVRMTMRHLAGRAGATAIEAELPFPIDSPRTVIEVIERHITERTKLLIIDEITSPTALRMPVGEVIELCATRGIDVLVDGAHAPGMVEVNLESDNSHQPAYYAGNLHKWGCAPIGTAFLWVRPDKQTGLHPTTISHFLDQGLAEEFQWQGTRDISGWLATPAALAYMADLGWEKVREHNHRMAVWVMHLLCERWGVEPTSPMDGSMLGSMVTLPVPQRVRERYENAEQLQAKLYHDHRIEIPIIDWNGAWWVRASCQVYNTADQYDRLASSMIACGA
jgi:isopenicillin-N epimerase